MTTDVDVSIRNAILIALFSNDKLADLLTLKGAQSLILQNVSDRTTQDLDFSISHQQNINLITYKSEIKKSLDDELSELNFKIIRFKMQPTPHDKPKFIPNPLNTDFQIMYSGYTISFGIITFSEYDKQKIHSENKGKIFNPDTLDALKVEIDISEGEFTEPRTETNLEGLKIYLYTPLMTLYEKARASVQQLSSYNINPNNQKIRSRDIYDIYNLMTQSKSTLANQIYQPKNIKIMKNIFFVKGVDVNNLSKISSIYDVLENDFITNVMPQLDIKVRNNLNFKAMFNYVNDIFEKLKNKTNILDEDTI